MPARKPEQKALQQKESKAAKGVESPSSTPSLPSLPSVQTPAPGELRTVKAQCRPWGKGKPPFFLSYQSRWILDEARLKLMEKSRQIGLSWSTAYALDRRKSRDTEHYDAWVSSRDDIQARLFLEDCKAFAGVLHIAAQDLGQQVVDPEKNSAYVLQFANGKRINSMSSNADAQAGKRGDRVLDEFALHPDPRKLYSIAFPGITWGGCMEIISTHRGTANFFNDLVQEIKERGNPKGFSLHRVTLRDALDAGFLFKLQQKLPADDPRQDMDEAAYFDFIRSGCPDEETFLQEYMCAPSNDAAAFLSYDLMQGCQYGAEEDWQTDLATCKNPLTIGYDVARKGDLSVIAVFEDFGGIKFLRRLITMKGQTFDAQERQFYALMDLPTVARACVDASGLGMQLAERAVQRYGHRVEAVTFTPKVKEELAYPLRAAFEDKTIRIPHDRALQADLRAVKKETTASGNTRFAADHGANGHADRFWALALGLHAAKNSGSPGRFARITTGIQGRAARTLAARRDRTLAG